jgi:hypothetical protein
MSVPSATSDFQAVSDLLAGIRRRIRTFVWAEAVLLALALVGVVFWGGLALDWMFEPSPQVRLVAHVALITAVLAILVWLGLRRWMVSLTDRSLALLVERKHPELQDALSVAVDLHATAPHYQGVHPELAERTIRQANQVAANLDTEDLLNQLRINRFALLVGALALSVVVLALAKPKVWETYTERLALSPDDWPRSVALSIDGFEPDGRGGYVRKVARNSDVPIVVGASLVDGLKSPERVTIRYRWQEGRRGKDDLIRIGDSEAGRDESQRFEYLFERIAGDVEFEVRGGDDRLRNLRLEVVERPKVTKLELNCVYPDYLERANRTLAAGPRVELPEGTKIVAVGEANKPLAEVRWRQIVQEQEGPKRIASATPGFESQLALGAHDVELEVELLDQDGIASAEPFRVTLVSRKDEMPQVLANRQGIGTSVTAGAMLPVELELLDDNAINSAWLDVKHGEAVLPKVEVPLAASTHGEAIAVATVDLQELAKAHPNDPTYAFAPGGQVTILASANDKFDLDDSLRTTTARPLTFQIVTEDELMAQLAGNEQNLRQTFEAVADKLLLLYDSLEKLEQDVGSGSAANVRDEDLLVVDTPGEELAEDAATEEPGDEANDTGRVGRDAVRLAETARQIGDEVLGVAGGFEDIHAQLFNNRIENSELSDRIGNRIAAPLRRLGDERMGAVANALTAISTGQPSALAKAEMRQAILEVEGLLREIQGLENYNEVIAMLREIIRQQEQINSKTQDQQKSELKNLLLD